MATFETPNPITVTVDVGVRGDVRIVAGDRADTVVEVRPRSASRALDARVAEQAVVEYAEGRLLVKLRPWRRYSWFSDGGAVDVTIQLPIGCSLDVRSGMGDLRCEGEFRSADLTTGMGQIRIDHCGGLRAKTGFGDVTVERVTGHADIVTASGKLRIGEIDGDAVIKNGNGDSLIGEITHELRAKAGNGDLVIDRAGGDVTAKSSNGSIRIGEVARGAITLETAYGSLEVGVHDGSVAWLDLGSKYGRVRNGLDTATGPGESGSTVEVRARTAYGNIIIQRSASSTRPRRNS